MGAHRLRLEQNVRAFAAPVQGRSLMCGRRGDKKCRSGDCGARRLAELLVQRAVKLMRLFAVATARNCQPNATDAASGQNPVTLAEFTLASGSTTKTGVPTDVYDVSNVDGFNLPMTVKPRECSLGRSLAAHALLSQSRPSVFLAGWTLRSLT